jgi:hypothetical protein
MRALIVFTVIAMTGPAHAQDPDPYPQPPPQDPQPQPEPQPPPPQSYAPPPQSYVPAQLSAADAALLQQGEITDGARVGGAVANWLLGFGIGQAIQGRYSDTGWIFTLGEAASMAALIYGISKICILDFENQCQDDSGGMYLVGGLIGLAVFRVWSIVDAIAAPTKHNARVRNIKMRLGMPVPMYTEKVTPYLHKARDGGGTVGLRLRF